MLDPLTEASTSSALVDLVYHQSDHRSRAQQPSAGCMQGRRTAHYAWGPLAGAWRHMVMQHSSYHLPCVAYLSIIETVLRSVCVCTMHNRAPEAGMTSLSAFSTAGRARSVQDVQFVGVSSPFTDCLHKMRT